MYRGLLFSFYKQQNNITLRRGNNELNELTNS